MANLRHNPVLEINVVDVLARKGYRFKGHAIILGEGRRFQEILEFYRRRGPTTINRHIVVLKVDHPAPLVSPGSDTGQSEAQVSATWRSYWERLWTGGSGTHLAWNWRPP